jgi:hypothetical protein
MAITRAQQARQMLKEGTKKPVKQAGATNYLGKQEMVTAPKFWLSEPDHVKAKLAYITDEEEQILIDKNLYGSLKGKPNIGPAGLPSLQGGDFGSEDKGSDNQSDGNDGGNDGGDDRREQVSVARTQGKRAPTPKEVRDIVSRGPERNTGLEQNRLSNIMKMDRFKTFKPEVKTPPLGVLRFLKGPLQGLSNFTTTKNRAFFEDVIRAGKIPGLNFATVSDMTDEELEKEYQDYMSARLSGETDAYGNPNPGFGKDDGPDPIIPLITTTDDTEDDTEDDPTNIFAKAGITPRIAGSIFAADGGRIGAAEGGIMDLESGRQMYFLGKLVKKATRAVKKIAKSPVGKAALLYGLGAMGGSFGAGKGLFSKGMFNPGNIARGLLGTKGVGMDGGTLGLFGKFGLTEGFGAMMPTIKGGITLASILPLLAGKTDEEKEDILKDYYASQKLQPSQSVRGVGSEMDFYKYNLPVTAADGGRIGYQEGSKEPVAKETMPLLDMGGKEMDLREDGGFVPIGRMEKADDVPARLSKNEFVFTADAVRNAGDGNVDKGAEVMYNMMKNLESGGDVSEESQGLEGAREMFQTSKRLEEVL